MFVCVLFCVVTCYAFSFLRMVSCNISVWRDSVCTPNSKPKVDHELNHVEINMAKKTDYTISVDISRTDIVIGLDLASLVENSSWTNSKTQRVTNHNKETKCKYFALQ